MEAAFWQNSWDTGKIGFHEAEPNPFLVKYMDRLRENGPALRALVPLCGKSEDLVVLANAGFEVVGVELVRQAATAFFEEHPALQPMRDEERFGAPARVGGKVTIVEKDVFAFDGDGTFDVVFDRASLVALRPADRVRYVDVVTRALRPCGSMLLVTFDYDQTKSDGPPFAVSRSDVEQLFGERFDVAFLETQPAAASPRLQALGIELREHAFFLTNRASRA